MRIFLFIIEIFKKFPLLLIISALLLAFVSLIEAATIFTIVPVVDFFLNPDLAGASPITLKAASIVKSLNLSVTVGNFVIIFLLLSVIGSGLQILVRHYILKTKYVVVRDLMVGSFKDFFDAQWRFFSSTKQGVLLNTFLKEMVVVGNAFGAIELFFTYIVQMVLYLAVPFYISWKVTSISLLVAVFCAAPLILLGKVNYLLGKLNTSTANQMSSIIQESLSSAKIILGFGNQRESVKMLDEAFEVHRQAAIKSQILNIAIPRIYYPLGLLAIIIALFSSRKFAVPLSETAALLYSFLKVVPFIGQITGQKNALDNFFPSYEQVAALRNSASGLKQETGEKKFSGLNKEILIKDVSFAYPGHGKVLSDINICIPKGKMIAFVSKSGEGKTTLLDLVMGFYKPTGGGVFIDGTPLDELDIISYRKRLGYVPQENILFNLSIRDNLLWSKPDANNDEIRQACQQANAIDFIEGFPKKYDTLVGDRGVRLSGGQAQRIALARAILRNPDILILDEATSSLDTYSERLIQVAIENIAKKTTIIIVAHRLSTIVNADYIYLLKDGRVSEEGTYTELIKKNGEFSKMSQLQVL